MAHKHPELITGLRLMSCGDFRTRVAAGLAMYVPWLGAALCFWRRGVVRVHEALRLRRRWRSGVDFLWAYSYWRGLHDALGSMKGLRELRRTAIAFPPQEVDVRRPLPQQVAGLNIDVPSSLVVLLDGRPVGRLDLKPTLNEPFLPWLSHQISAHLSEEIMAEAARASLSGSGEESILPMFLDPH